MWSEITDKWNEFAFQNNEKIENAKGNFGHAGRPGKVGGSSHFQHLNPEVQPLGDKERDMRVRTIQNRLDMLGIDENNLGTLTDSGKVLESCGWQKVNDTTYKYPDGFDEINFSELREDDFLVWNGAKTKAGKDALKNGGYESSFFDYDDPDLVDSPAIYTANREAAYEYTASSKGNKSNSRLTALTFKNSDIIVREDVKRLRSGFGSNLKGLPDLIVANLAGYSIMRTKDTAGQDEFAIINPTTLRIVKK